MDKSNSNFNQLFRMAEQIANLRNKQVKRRQAHLLCAELIKKLKGK